MGRAYRYDQYNYKCSWNNDEAKRSNKDTVNIREFRFAEMFSNSQGKTACSLVCAFMLIVTGCTMGVRGAFSAHADSMLQGLAFAGLGAGLLGVRRFTPDKVISQNAEPEKS
jgi:hypothetical protein